MHISRRPTPAPSTFQSHLRAFSAEHAFGAVGDLLLATDGASRGDLVAAVTAVANWPAAHNQRALATLLDERGSSSVDAARLRAGVLHDLVDELSRQRIEIEEELLEAHLAMRAHALSLSPEESTGGLDPVMPTVTRQDTPVVVGSPDELAVPVVTRQDTPVPEERALLHRPDPTGATPQAFEEQLRGYFSERVALRCCTSRFDVNEKVTHEPPPCAGSPDARRRLQLRERLDECVRCLEYVEDAELTEAPPGRGHAALLVHLDRLVAAHARGLGGRCRERERELMTRLAAYCERGGRRCRRLCEHKESLDHLWPGHEETPVYHKHSAAEVDVHGGDASADDFMDAFGL